MEEIKPQDLPMNLQVLLRDKAVGLNEAIPQSIERLTKAVQRYAGSGEITIKIKAKANNGKLDWSASVVEKVPQPSPSILTLYADKKGRLSFDDPDQEALPGMGNKITAIK